jgi:hypothetical protein
MELSQSKTTNLEKKIALSNIFEWLFYFHLTILFFQIPLREVFLDITLWRDIGIILILALWIPLSLISNHSFQRKFSLKTAIQIFILYGVLNFLVNVGKGSSLIQAFTYFRNHYFPFLLFFPACYAFKHTRAQKHLISFLATVLLIYMISPVLELFLKMFDFPLAKIPWYGYTFAHSDRFEGNELGGYIKQDESPILGFLGFPHYTVVLIVALFALIYPFLFAGKAVNKETGSSGFRVGSSSYSKYIFLSFFIFSVLIFQVRTHMISAFLVLFVFAPKKIRKVKYLVTSTIFFLVMYFLFSTINASSVSNLVDSFVVGFIGREGNISSLSVILSVNELQFIISSSFSNLFFGHGYDVIANVSFDEFLGANSSGWEVKIFYYTAVYGLLWLMLFVYINVKAFSYIKSNLRLFPQNSFEYMYSMGLKVMMIIFIIDAGHYMRMMTWPSLDIWIICLGVLAAINAKAKSQNANPDNSLYS